MNLHSLKNTNGARKRAMRVGRGEGSGKGKTSGRGAKGQGSRAGSGYTPTFEGGQMPLIRRLPKFGFTNRNRKEYLAINVSALEVFDEGSDVTLDALRAAGFVKGRRLVKILGQGDLGKKLAVQAHAFSASAKEKIEAAGGTATVVN